MEQTQTAMSGKSIQSVTSIWMQGERDAKEFLSEHYEEAFVGILEQLKSDLGIEELNCIIGRLSDWGIDRKDWDKIREIQKKLGEAGPRSAWVNTDDLNGDNKRRDGTKLKPNNLHYSKEGYDVLAKRYVEKVKQLVKSREVSATRFPGVNKHERNNHETLFVNNTDSPVSIVNGIRHSSGSAESHQ